MVGRFKAEADVAVDFREAVVAVLVGHAEADVRVALTECAQVRRQPARGSGRWCDDTQALAQVRHAHCLQGAFDVVEGIAQLGGEGKAGLG